MSVCCLRFSWCCQLLQTYGSNWFVLTITVTSTHFSTLRMRHICYKFVDRQGPVKTYLKNILFRLVLHPPSPPPLKHGLACCSRPWLFKGHLHGMVYIMGIDFFFFYFFLIKNILLWLNNSWAHLLILFWEFSVVQKGFGGVLWFLLGDSNYVP